MIDLNQFYKWQQEKRNQRSVTIEIGSASNSEHLRVWVYDYELMAGQYVTSVDEIDLKKEKERKEREEYKRLKKKFEEGQK